VHFRENALKTEHIFAQRDLAMINPQNTQPAPAPPARIIKEVTQRGYLSSIEAMRTWSIRTRTINIEEPPLVNVINLATDIIAREDITARTKNAYRAALLWHLRQQTQLETADQAALTMLEKWAPWELPKPKLRPRTIRLADLDRLNDELMSQGGKWSLRTSHWILAGLATGLRPREWLHARWTSSEQSALHVQCSKTKLSTPAFLQNATRFEPRAEPFGTGTVERTVPVTKDFDRMAIDAHMRNIRANVEANASPEEQEKQFARYYHQCRTCMRRACQKIWNGRKMYSLYTMRSQFSANAKAAHGSDTTAILMGHSSADSPSTGHYGKASQSHIPSTRISTFAGVPLMRPAPAEADTDADATQAPAGDL